MVYRTKPVLVITVSGQTININGQAGGKRLMESEPWSGGGATSVLLKDYPEPQRSQILDFLFNKFRSFRFSIISWGSRGRQFNAGIRI